MKAMDMQLKRLGFWIGPLVLASLVPLLFVSINDSTPWYQINVGYFYGMFFTHPILAAVWMGLGPGSLRVRLAGSATWLLAIMLFCLLGIWLEDSSQLPETAAVIVASTATQWLLLQPLFLILVSHFGIGIRHASTDRLEHVQNSTQFGIRHVLGLMSGTALLLWLGRMIFPNLHSYFEFESVVFIGFHDFVNLLTQVPLAMGVLVRRRAALAVLLALILVVITTFFEYPILESRYAGDDSYLTMISKHTFSVALTLSIAGIVRLNGFRLINSIPQQSVPPTQTQDRNCD